jgi:trehalose 6-phosphate phosphatase
MAAMSPATHNDPRLDEASQEKLRTVFAVRPRGLFSDVDGTLSAIAPTPEAAVLLPGVANELERLRQVFDVVAAVSGRSAADTRRMVGVAGITYLGNHGLERLDPRWSVGSGTGGASEADEAQIQPDAEAYVADVNAALDDVEATLGPRYPGLRVERKGITGSIHVRNVADPDAAEEAVLRAVTTIAVSHGLRVTQGKRVVEVRPPVDIDKGAAVAELIQSRGLLAAIYLGDDRTDLAAFRVLRDLAVRGDFVGVGVAVLHAEAPAELEDAADIILPGAEAVPALLQWLAEQG